MLVSRCCELGCKLTSFYFVGYQHFPQKSFAFIWNLPLVLYCWWVLCIMLHTHFTPLHSVKHSVKHLFNLIASSRVVGGDFAYFQVLRPEDVALNQSIHCEYIDIILILISIVCVVCKLLVKCSFYLSLHNSNRHAGGLPDLQQRQSNEVAVTSHLIWILDAESTSLHHSPIFISNLPQWHGAKRRTPSSIFPCTVVAICVYVQQELCYTWRWRSSSWCQLLVNVGASGYFPRILRPQGVDYLNLSPSTFSCSVCL